MPVPAGWSASRAVAACPTIPWNGEVSRFHSRRYEATDAGGSLVHPGRYHDGWPALYTCLRAEAAVGELLHDTDYRLTQQIGAASVALGIEGILVPSATLLGDNLVVWTSQLRSTSRIVVVSSEDPRPYVPR